MPKKMTKSQIAAHIAKKADIKKKVAAQILDEIAALACKEAKNSFTFPGLGRFELVKRKARTGRNPRTGEILEIPAKQAVKFRLSQSAKEEILGKRAAKKKSARFHGGGGGH